jgi:hypothetical protein
VNYGHGNFFCQDCSCHVDHASFHCGNVSNCVQIISYIPAPLTLFSQSAIQHTVCYNNKEEYGDFWWGVGGLELNIILCCTDQHVVIIMAP